MMNFLPETSTLMTYTLACVVLFITPGPDMSLFLSKTLTGGRRNGLSSMAGAFTGALFHTVFAAVGLSALLAASATAFTILKIVGALYLLWLAIDAIRFGCVLNTQGGPDGKQADLSRGQNQQPGETSSPPLMKTYLQGIGVNLTNPKVVLFFVTFLPQFVSATDPFAAQKLLFLGIYFVAISTPLAIAMILGAAQLIDYLKYRPRILRAMDWLFAGVFAGFAVKILLTQEK